MNQTQIAKKTIWLFELLNELNIFDMLINVDKILEESRCKIGGRFTETE